MGAIEELVFSDDHSSSVRHRGLLTLGSVARQVRSSDPQLAKEVTETLHTLLEQHMKGEYV